MDIPYLVEPLTPAEIAARLDDNGMVSGLVAVDLADLIDGDLESVLDLLSERLIDSALGMQIDYEPVHVQQSEIIIRVTLDPSMVLDDHGEQETA